LAKYYELTDGLVGVYPGDKPPVWPPCARSGKNFDSDQTFKKVLNENYSPEVLYLAKKGYLVIHNNNDSWTKYYTITYRTVDLVEQAQQGRPLVEFELDFDPAALRQFKKDFEVSD
jgi:hypothetical protein